VHEVAPEVHLTKEHLASLLQETSACASVVAEPRLHAEPQVESRFDQEFSYPFASHVIPAGGVHFVQAQLPLSTVQLLLQEGGIDLYQHCDGVQAIYPHEDVLVQLDFVVCNGLVAEVPRSYAPPGQYSPLAAGAKPPRHCC